MNPEKKYREILRNKYGKGHKYSEEEVLEIMLSIWEGFKIGVERARMVKK